MSRFLPQQTDDVRPDESISQVMIDSELEEERDIFRNSEKHTTQESTRSDRVSGHNPSSVPAYFIVTLENIEEGRAFLKVQSPIKVDIDK